MNLELKNEVYKKIREALTAYRLSNWVDSDGDPHPLIDHLSESGKDISTGQREIEYIVDQICYYIDPLLEDKP